MKKFNATLAAEKKDRDAKSKIEEENVKALSGDATKKLPAKKAAEKDGEKKKADEEEKEESESK